MARLVDMDKAMDDIAKGFCELKCDLGYPADSDTTDLDAAEEMVKACIKNSAVPCASSWVSAEQKPESNKSVFLIWQENGEMRRICEGRYVAGHTLNADDYGYDHPCDYDEETDIWWMKEGWYEVIRTFGNVTVLAWIDSDVTHWMPMPPMPEHKEGNDGGIDNGN